MKQIPSCIPLVLLLISFIFFVLFLVTMFVNFLKSKLRQKLPWFYSIKDIISLFVLLSFFVSVYLGNIAIYILSTQSCQLPDVLFNPLVTSFQLIALNADFPTLTARISESILDCNIINIYVELLFLVAPIVGGATLFSLIKDFFPDIHISAKFWIRRSKNVQLFSYLNEQSFNLAVSLTNKDPKCTIIFANTKDEDVLDSPNNTVSRSHEKGFFCLSDDLSSISVVKAKSVKYYFVQENDIDNLDDAIYLANNGKHNWKSNANIEFNVFAQSEISKDVLERLSNDVAPKNSNKHKIQIRIIPYKTNTIYNLLFEQPLYKFLSNPEDTEKLNIAIIGENEWATEIFKTVLWCGQLPNKQLNIYCIAKNLSAYKAKLKYLIPELDQFSPAVDGMPYCNIQWVSRSNDNYYNYLEQLNTKNIPIWFVCDDSEEDSIEIALYLRKLIGSTNTGLTNPPKGIVYYQTYNNNVATVMNGNQQQIPSGSGLEYNCQLHAFGSVGDQYALKNFDGQLMNFSQVIDDIHAQNADINPVSEYRKRSSLAAALHLSYKLYALQLLDQSVESDKLESKIIEILTDNVLWNNLSYQIGHIEHVRWIAYMRSIGYINVPITNWINYYRSDEGKFKINLVKSNTDIITTNSIDTKDHIRKLHTCLVPYPSNSSISEMFIKNVPGFSEGDYTLLKTYYDQKKLDPLDAVSYQLLMLERELGIDDGTSEYNRRDLKYNTANTLQEISDRYRAQLTKPDKFYIKYERWIKQSIAKLEEMFITVLEKAKKITQKRPVTENMTKEKNDDEEPVK